MRIVVGKEIFRQFGLTPNKNNSYTFFARGADRVWAGLDAMLNSQVFEVAHKLWTTAIGNFSNYLNNYGISAIITPSVSKRISWSTD